MKNLISADNKHLLYRDECKETFLLLKFMEVYQKSSTTLGVTCWSIRIYHQLKKRGIISNELVTDDKLYTFEVESSNLQQLISTGSHIRRVNRKGRWLLDKEKRLAHRIIPYNPSFGEEGRVTC